MQTILLVIDNLNDSINTLEVGASMVTESNMHLILVRNKMKQKNVDTARENEFTSQLRNLLPEDLRDKTKISFVELPDANLSILRELATESNTELIIIGEECEQTFADMFLCNKKWENQHNPASPILFLKKEYKFLCPKSILFACDFKPESITAFHRIQKLSQLWDSQLKLLYVTLPGSEFLSSKEVESRVYKFLTNAEITNPLTYLNELGHYADYSLEEGILSYADIISADLIAMPTHGYSGLSRTGNCSIGEDVAIHSKRPVLAVRI